MARLPSVTAATPAQPAHTRTVDELQIPYLPREDIETLPDLGAGARDRTGGLPFTSSLAQRYSSTTCIDATASGSDTSHCTHFYG